ncbi:MAG: peptide MFS transporter [Sphingomonadales bacterium]
MSDAALDAPPIQLFGLPKGAALIVFIEFWERFSFYGMLAIFALFLIAPVSEGGFGWSEARALGLIGLYSGLMYGLPFLGGRLADRLLSTRICVQLGLFLMTLGHFLLAGPAILPRLIGGSGADAAILALPGPLGGLSLPSGLGPEGASAFYAITTSFWAALLCLVLGNALMKATLAVLLGDQFRRDDPNRSVGFASYYFAISVGALIAGLSIGTIAERVGWHYGFSIAGFGIAIALCAFTFLGPSWLKAVQIDAVGPQRAAENSRQAWTRLALVACAGLAMAMFMAAWFQIFGSWTVYTNAEIDRLIYGFEVPVSWFISLNSAVVICAAPFAARFFKRQAQHSQSVDFFAKLAFCLGLACAAHALMASSGQLQLSWLILPVIGIVLLSLGELVAWVPAYDFVYKAAPPGYQSAVMGAWYLFALGLSGFLAGQLGSVGASAGYGGLFITFTIALGLACAVLLVLRPWLVSLAHRHALEL